MAVQWTRLSYADQVMLDRLLAATLLVIGQVEVWVGGSFGDARWISSPLVALASLALLGRRRAALATMTVVAVAFALHLVGVSATGGDPALPESVALVAVWVVAAYSVGAHTTTTKAVVGAVVGAALPVVYAAASDSVELEPVDVLFILVPWFAGRALRRQRAQAIREREERARSAVHEERARIARELHDIVAHSVSVIAIQADAAEGALARDPALAAAPLGAVKDVARETLAELRRAVGVLRESDAQSLSPRPGLQQLPALVEQTRAAGLAVDLRTEGAPRPLTAGEDLSAYRIVQEALTNVRKHAGPARATVLVRYDDTSVTLEITDDGAGPPSGELSRGHGLLGIRERVALYGGSLDSGRGPGGGFVVRVVLPIDGSPR